MAGADLVLGHRSPGLKHAGLAQRDAAGVIWFRQQPEIMSRFAGNQRRLRGEWVSKSFKAAVRRAGLDERLHFHSMRHGYASWLVQKGASLYEVQKLLGHTSITVTQVYAHLAPSELHDTVNRIHLDLHSGVS